MIYMFLAHGFEEVEAIAPLDVIRRASIEIKTVGIGNKTIVGSHSVPVVCDLTEDEINLDNNLKGIILPGGMPGTTNLMENDTVNSAIDFCSDNNLLICAICAAPMILGRKGLLTGKEAICFPGFEDELTGAKISSDFVCKDGNIITAKGMGSAVNFGLEIVKYFAGKDAADKLKSTLQCS